MKLEHFIMITLAAIALLFANLSVGSQGMLELTIKGSTMITMYFLGLYAKSQEK